MDWEGHEDYSLQTTDGGESWTSFQIDSIYGDGINKFLRVSETEMYAIGNRIYKYTTSPTRSHSISDADSFDNSLCTLKATRTGDSFSITYTVPEDDNVQITLISQAGYSMTDRSSSSKKQARIPSSLKSLEMKRF